MTYRQQAERETGPGWAFQTSQPTPTNTPTPTSPHLLIFLKQFHQLGTKHPNPCPYGAILIETTTCRRPVHSCSRAHPVPSSEMLSRAQAHSQGTVNHDWFPLTCMTIEPLFPTRLQFPCASFMYVLCGIKEVLCKQMHSCEHTARHRKCRPWYHMVFTYDYMKCV